MTQPTARTAFSALYLTNTDAAARGAYAVRHRHAHDEPLRAVLGYVRTGMRNGVECYLWSDSNASVHSRSAWRIIGPLTAFPGLADAAMSVVDTPVEGTALSQGNEAVEGMRPQPCQPQQGRDRRTAKPARGERRYVTVRDTETGEVHRVLTSVAVVRVAVVLFTPSNRHRQGDLGGMLITHDDMRKAWVFGDAAEATRMLSRNRAPGERVIPAELVADPAPVEATEAAPSVEASAGPAVVGTLAQAVPQPDPARGLCWYVEAFTLRGFSEVIRRHGPFLAGSREESDAYQHEALAADVARKKAGLPAGQHVQGVRKVCLPHLPADAPVMIRQPAQSAPVEANRDDATEAEAGRRARAAGWHYCAKSDAWTHDAFEDYAGTAVEACEMAGISLDPVEAPAMVPQPCQQPQARDARAPVEASPAPVEASDARPVIWFEQDGAFFCYRDRPFYQTDFDAFDDTGMSLGVCPTFCIEAPFRFPDFDMEGAERSAAWFEAECERHGYRAERAPDYQQQPSFPAHPECEHADLARSYRISHSTNDQTGLDAFAAIRAAGDEGAERAATYTEARALLDVAPAPVAAKPAIVWTRRLRKLARTVTKKGNMHKRDPLAERAARAERFKLISATTRNGMIPLDIGSRDCDGYTTRWRRSIRPSVMAYEVILRGLYDNAEGPVWAYIPERYLARAGMLDSY